MIQEKGFRYGKISVIDYSSFSSKRAGLGLILPSLTYLISDPKDVISFLISINSISFNTREVK